MNYKVHDNILNFDIPAAKEEIATENLSLVCFKGSIFAMHFLTPLTCAIVVYVPLPCVVVIGVPFVFV